MSGAHKNETFHETIDRFIKSVDFTSTCWNWKNELHRGYGCFWWKFRRFGTHRFMWELFISRIPEGLVLDHLCRNTKCCNPKHLEIVTPTENNFRKRKTHCIRGHEFTVENVYIWKNSYRSCRTCRTIQDRLCKERKRNAKS